MLFQMVASVLLSMVAFVRLPCERALKTESETDVINEFIFCLGSPIEKTNSDRLLRIPPCFFTFDTLQCLQVAYPRPAQVPGLSRALEQEASAAAARGPGSVLAPSLLSILTTPCGEHSCSQVGITTGIGETNRRKQQQPWVRNFVFAFVPEVKLNSLMEVFLILLLKRCSSK